MATAKEAVRAAEDRLRTAWFGLEDMEQRPERFISGLMNAVVFSRAVSFALQTMKGHVEGWEEWYSEKQSNMAQDDAMKFFRDLRNNIEKTAKDHLEAEFRIKFSGDDLAVFEPRPPGAVSIVFGVQEYGGASGWRIIDADGTESFYFVKMPESMVKWTFRFIGAPQGIKDDDARMLIRQHLEKMQSLVAEVKSRFIS